MSSSNDAQTKFYRNYVVAHDLLEHDIQQHTTKTPWEDSQEESSRPEE